MAETEDLVAAFIFFQETEKDASPRTVRNYTQALNAFIDFSGENFLGWRNCTAEH